MVTRRFGGICAAFGILLSCAWPVTAQQGVQSEAEPANKPPAPRLFSGPGFFGKPEPTAAAPGEEVIPPTYGLKEFKLGMSLDDFTKIGAPTGADRAKVKGVCSCDVGQQLESVNEADGTAQVAQCGFWTNWKENGAKPYRMTIAGVECSPDFRFIKQNGVYKLMEINISFFSSNYNIMENALVEKFGQPTTTTPMTLKTDSGNIYKTTHRIWDDGVGRIRLSDVDGNNTTRAKLRYIHLPLYSAYTARLNNQDTTLHSRGSGDL